jgi:hypothetical protein
VAVQLREDFLQSFQVHPGPMFSLVVAKSPTAYVVVVEECGVTCVSASYGDGLRPRSLLANGLQKADMVQGCLYSVGTPPVGRSVREARSTARTPADVASCGAMCRRSGRTRRVHHTPTVPEPWRHHDQSARGHAGLAHAHHRAAVLVLGAPPDC